MHESSKTDWDVLLWHLSLDNVLLVEQVERLPEVGRRINTTEPVVPHVQAQVGIVSRRHNRTERVRASHSGLLSSQMLLANNRAGGGGVVGGDRGDVGNRRARHNGSEEGVDLRAAASSLRSVVGGVVVGWFVPVFGDVDESHIVESAVDDFVLDSVEAPWHEWILLHDLLVVLITAA